MRRVVVIGAGPAGLAAARNAIAMGADVTVLDEGARSGGQFWRHQPSITEPRLQHRWRTYLQLDDAVRRVVVQRASVWSIEQTSDASHASAHPIRVHALVGPADGTDRAGLTLEADALVIATGAHDRALPIPGWTLPGVITAGAAQALAKRDGVAVGSRTVVTGAGPFLLPVAASLAAVGSTVVEVLEASGVGALARGWGARPWQLAASAGKSGELAEYARDLMRGRTPYRVGQGVVRILGGDCVEAVEVARLDADWRPIDGTTRTVECDAVAIGHGFTPRLETAIAAGCDITHDRLVAVDDAQRTSVHGVLAAGEATGIGGADASLAEGAIAGFVAAGGSLDDRRIRGAVRARRTAHAFAARIEAAHGIRPGWTSWLDADTVVCRCESVTRARIEEFAAAPSRAMRLASRAGLGACQGRTCGRSVEQLVAAQGGDVGGAFDRRPVLGSARLGEIARDAAPRSTSET